MAKNKGLGRGLDAIFVDNSIPAEDSQSLKTKISMSLIDTNPTQPRKTFEESALSSLAESISINGLLQPILLRAVGERYEIIAGERRFRASKIAGLTEIPAMVIEADDEKAAALALIENIQRENLNPYEEAEAYNSLMKEYKMTQEEVATKVSRSRSAVANSLRLLDLPDDIAKLLVNGKLSAGHARALLGLSEKEKISSVAELVIEKALSVREVEELVRKINKSAAKNTAGKDGKNKPVKVDYSSQLEERFTKATGRRCKITSTKAKKTFLVEYRDNEDLENILKLLAGDNSLDDFN